MTPLRALCLLLAISAAADGAQTLTIVRHEGIAVDGDPADFDRSRPIRLDSREQIGWKVDEWRGTNDLSATAYLNYDDRYLYLGIEVRDDQVWNRYHPSYNVSVWNGDCIEWYLSSSFSAKRTNRTYSPGDLQLMITPPIDGKPSYIVKAKDGNVWTEPLTIEEALVAGRRTPGGYAIEARIPLYALNRGGRNDVEDLGMNLAVLDADGGNARFKMSVNGRNEMPSQLVAFLPATLKGKPPANETRWAFEWRSAWAIAGFLALYALYILAMRGFIGRGVAAKRRAFLVAFLVSASLGALALAVGYLERSRSDRHAREAVRLGEALLTGLGEGFLGQMDLPEFSDRLLETLTNGGCSRRVPYRSFRFSQEPGMMASADGAPWRAENFDPLGFDLPLSIDRAEALHVFAVPSGAFPVSTNGGRSARLLFSGPGGERAYAFSNGVNLFDNGYPFSMQTRDFPPGVPFTPTAPFLNQQARHSPRATNFPHVAYHYRIPLGGGRLTGIRYVREDPALVIQIKGLTVETAEAGSNRFRPLAAQAQPSLSWNGTRFDAFPSDLVFYPFIDASQRRASIRFIGEAVVDEIRFLYSTREDALYLGFFPPGTPLATLTARDGSATAASVELLDGIHCDNTGLKAGYGHPDYFASRIGAKLGVNTGGLRPNDPGNHLDELAVPLGSPRRVDEVELRRLRGDTWVAPYGVTGIQRGDFLAPSVSNEALRTEGGRYALSPEASRAFSGLRSGVFSGGELLLPGFPRDAADRARTHFMIHPPADYQTFPRNRHRDIDEGRLLFVPFPSASNAYAFPSALVLNQSREPGPFPRILRALLALSIFLLAVFAALFATHFLVDGKRLSLQMAVYSLVITVLPMAITAAVFIVAYNRTMDGLLTAALLDKKQTLVEEIAGIRSELRRAAVDQISGRRAVDDPALFTLTHRIRPGDGLPTVAFSSNTPPQFLIPPASRLLRQSDVVFNSRFGLVIAQTAAKSDAGGVETVTAFRFLDRPTLERLRRKIGAHLGVHYWQGFPLESTLSPRAAIPVPESGTEEFFASGANIAMRSIDGSPYMTILFPVLDERGSGAAHLSLAVDASAQVRTRWLIVSIILLIAIVIAAFTWLISNWLTGVISRAVMALSGGMERVEGGDLKVEVTVEAKNELGYLAQRFNAMVKGLHEKTQIEKYARELESLNTQLRHASDIYLKDLRMASAVQRQMLQGESPSVEGYEIAFAYLPSSGVSGDLYDVYARDGAFHGLVIADVSGHGISSGLLTTLAKPIFYKGFNARGNASLETVVNGINREIVQAKGDVENYLTAILFSISAGRVEYANCGHPPMLLRRPGSPIAPLPGPKDPKGFMLGLAGTEEFFERSLAVGRFEMLPGDTLILYTDGLTEAADARGNLFETEGIAKAVDPLASGASAAEHVEAILVAAKRHAGESPYADDLTLIVVRRLGA